MTLGTGLQQLYRWFLDLILPPRCVVCGKVDIWLCETCTSQLSFFEGPQCPKCGRLWKGSGLCSFCRDRPPLVASIRSAFLFQGAIQDAIYAFKYRGARRVGILLAQCMAEFWLQTPETIDVLIPVPLHPDRERQRGYNQAAILAETLGCMIERPVATGALVRVRPTRSQTKLNVAERRRNVADAFTCVMGEDIRGRDIMLVDDVATTGATLDACAVALLAGGARSVRAFTLARAV